MVYRFVILLDLIEILNIKSIILKWSLWDVEVGEVNKDIFKSDNILVKGFIVDVLVIMIMTSGYLKGSVNMWGNVGVVGF